MDEREEGRSERVRIVEPEVRGMKRATLQSMAIAVDGGGLVWDFWEREAGDDGVGGAEGTEGGGGVVGCADGGAWWGSGAGDGGGGLAGESCEGVGGCGVGGEGVGEGEAGGACGAEDEVRARLGERAAMLR